MFWSVSIFDFLFMKFFNLIIILKMVINFWFMWLEYICVWLFRDKLDPSSSINNYIVFVTIGRYHCDEIFFLFILLIKLSQSAIPKLNLLQVLRIVSCITFFNNSFNSFFSEISFSEHQLFLFTKVIFLTEFLINIQKLLIWSVSIFDALFMQIFHLIVIQKLWWYIFDLSD